MRKFFGRLAKEELGATAIEYGLIAALIAVAAISALTTVGEEVTGTFEKAGNTLETANAGPAAP